MNFDVILHDKNNPHVLARQMDASIQMLEKHYSHLKVQEAIEQLRGYDTWCSLPQ